MADVNLSNEESIATEMVDNSSPIGTGNRIDSSMQGPPKKMRRFENNPNDPKSKGMERLEYRLGGILCCAVCLDLPNSAVYQV